MGAPTLLYPACNGAGRIRRKPKLSLFHIRSLRARPGDGADHVEPGGKAQKTVRIRFPPPGLAAEGNGTKFARGPPFLRSFSSSCRTASARRPTNARHSGHAGQSPEQGIRFFFAMGATSGPDRSPGLLAKH